MIGIFFLVQSLVLHVTRSRVCMFVCSPNMENSYLIGFYLLVAGYGFQSFRLESSSAFFSPLSPQLGASNWT